ncbi:MAG TPA: family 20 glycosylhydrolase [Terriglobales bacterium]|nr:family 20 glycosylhydrolase [Terriglobales bacterium]
MNKHLRVSLLAAVAIALAASWLAAPAAAGPARGVTGLMPVPDKITVIDGRFRIDENLGVAGPGQPGSRVFHAAARFMARLAGRPALFFKQDYLLSQSASKGPAVSYSFQRVGRLEPNEDESYALSVKPDGITLSAVTDIGVLRGFETLLQLLDADEAGYYFPCVEVQDRPRFTWRGLLIDVGRHFEPVDVIKRNLDGMAAVKLNVLHWHLTEDQGFRVESKVFPKLHERGSDGMFYTRDEIRDVVAYAADRGIRVMPEFDVPGHSTSWLVAYPELAAAPGPYELERHFGVFGPAFDPTSERVYGFFDKFFREMAGLFPDPYIHIGGDEVNPDQWNANRAIRAYMKSHGLANNDALQAQFNTRILRILTKLGKKMVGWDEIFQPTLPKTIVIHSWRGPESLIAAAQKGYQGILSNGYYIDLCQPAVEHYLNDPIPAGSPLSDAEKALVLGGEATMWGEMVTPETIDSRIWPRTAAIAERLWSPAGVKNVDDMYRRLALVETELEELGLTHLKYQAMMLRRLAGATDVRPLEVLAGVTEPLRGYERSAQGVTYSTLSPYTRFVDACFPESLAARDFRVKVGRFLESRDPALAEELRSSLVCWKKNHPLVLPFLASSPALREVEGLSMALESVSAAGLEALAFLVSGKAPEKGWVEGRAKLLEEAKKPRAQSRLAVVEAVEKLVAACAPAGK